MTSNNRNRKPKVKIWSRKYNEFSSEIYIFFLKGFIGVFIISLLFVVMLFVYLINSDLPIPGSLVKKIQQELELNSHDYVVQFDTMSVKVDKVNLRPSVTLGGVHIAYKSDKKTGEMRLRELKLAFTIWDIMKGKILPIKIEVLDPELILVKHSKVRYSVGSENGFLSPNVNKSLDNQPFSEPVKRLQDLISSRLEIIKSNGIRLAFEDQEKQTKFILNVRNSLLINR